MKRQRVKICGISDTRSAEVAISAGADYIGVVFYPGSHRYVEPDQAREIADSARAASNGRAVGVVGLFVNEPLDHVLHVREHVGLDILQLSGNESPEYMAELSKRGVSFIGTVRGGGASERETTRRFREIVEQEPYAIILDTHVPGMWGGSGVVGDWTLARELASEYRLLLAGGLDPSNVGAAVREVQPFVVDVSTGVETDKQKDHSKIRAFIAAARGTEGEPQ
ncbi:MAG: phosphoribosylanthranilate isomerase [Thermomicrobiales bacterium]